MVFHIILYSICFALVFAFNILDSGYVPFLADVVFLTISLVSLITLISIRKRTLVEFVNELEVVERENGISIPLRIINNSHFPVPICKVKAKCYEQSGKRKIKRISFFCNPHSDNIRNINLNYKTCGNYRIKIKKIYFIDFFQLLMFSKKINISTDILVMPKLPEGPVLSKLQMDMSGDNDNVYSTKKAGDDPTEIFAIREYAPGDKIRNIHWKLTSKIGDVMVKDYGLPLFEKDTIVIDFVEKKRDKAILDELYDLLHGLIYTMTSRGFGLSVYFYNEEFRNVRIENENDILNFFAELYLIKKNSEVSCAEFYYANHEGMKNRVFYVTDRLNELAENRMRLLEETGPVYYLIPKSTGGGEYLIRFDR